jgi:hypothetical protein
MDESALQELAAACARRLPRTPSSFHDDQPAFSAPFDALLAAVRQGGERFAFDLEGRPAALAAIRMALPAIEAELLDAVIEDVTCEMNARQEALYRIAIAASAGSAAEDV